MEQGLKERLIGAAVLVGLGVWLIPWVLDGSGPEEQAATELELPAQEALPMRTHTIDLSEPRETPASPAASVTPERVSRAEAEPAAPPSPAANPQPAAPQTANAETPEDDAPAATVAAAEPAAAPSGDAPEASDEAAEPPAAAAKLEAEPQKAPEASRPAASGEWMVQLGSFGQEENAKRLAERVRTFGYRPDISNVRAGGRLMYRVRVGPHATRGQAEAAASSLSAHGFVAQVVVAE
ncbi:MAG TPA: SPOR domain-containing protein [Gammaproteobacteria bacterium]